MRCGKSSQPEVRALHSGPSSVATCWARLDKLLEVSGLCCLICHRRLLDDGLSHSVLLTPFYVVPVIFDFSFVYPVSMYKWRASFKRVSPLREGTLSTFVLPGPPGRVRPWSRHSEAGRHCPALMVPTFFWGRQNKEKYKLPLKNK